MKLLILTQYFPPEIGAPQNRLMSLSRHLSKLGMEVHVLTAMPNYPQGVVFEAYRNLRFKEEQSEGIRIFRTSIYATARTSVASRLRNYFSFSWYAWRCGANKLPGGYDVVLCESPPLFLGITAVLLCKKWGADLVMNISDLWPESAVQMGIIRNRLLVGMATRLEEWIYRKSLMITGQTQGIVENISCRITDKKVFWLPNGIDLERFHDGVRMMSLRRKLGIQEDAFVVLYAGIIGHAQGLEVIPKAAKILLAHKSIYFVLVGGGPVKEALASEVGRMGLDNVRLMDPVPSEKMPGLWAACDAAVIPLRNLELFHGAIPSKIFEALAMKKPILLGVEGEAKNLFIETAHAGIPFVPEDARSLASAILKLCGDDRTGSEMGKRGHLFVSEKFNRRRIAEAFYDTLKNQL